MASGGDGDTTAEDFGAKVAQLPFNQDAYNARVNSLKGGGGGPTYDDMNPRVIRLKEWAKLSDERMARVESKLDDLGRTLSALPSRNDMFVGLGIVVAVIALVFGGMAWLDGRRQPQALGPAPVYQQTAPAAPTPPTIIIQAAPPPADRR